MALSALTAPSTAGETRLRAFDVKRVTEIASWAMNISGDRAALGLRVINR